jgi:hypothetical protein
LNINFDDDGSKHFHAQQPFPSSNGVYTIDNENDSVTFSTHQLIVPVLRVLKIHYPVLEFTLSTEVTTPVEVFVGEEFIDMDEDEDDYCPIHRMQCRLDMSVKACRAGDPEGVVVLIIEHKRAGLIDRDDWTSGFDTRRRELRRNAIEFARQTRKYMVAEEWNLCSVFDSVAFVGTYLKEGDQPLWNKQVKLDLAVYFTDDRVYFPFALFALIKQGLILRGFI